MKDKKQHSNPPTRNLALFMAVFALAFALANLSPVFAEGFNITRKIPIAGQASWDYLTVDEGGRRLYVSHGT